MCEGRKLEMFIGRGRGCSPGIGQEGHLSSVMKRMWFSEREITRCPPLSTLRLMRLTSHLYQTMTVTQSELSEHWKKNVMYVIILQSIFIPICLYYIPVNCISDCSSPSETREWMLFCLVTTSSVPRELCLVHSKCSRNMY